VAPERGFRSVISVSVTVDGEIDGALLVDEICLEARIITVADVYEAVAALERVLAAGFTPATPRLILGAQPSDQVAQGEVTLHR
jgi:hypothetical protein